MRVLRVYHSAVVDAWRARERELSRRGHAVTVLGATRWNEGGSVVTLEPHPGEDVHGLATFGTHPALFTYDPRPIWRALGERWDVLDLHEEPFALATAEVLAIRAIRRSKVPYLLYSAQNLDKTYPPPFRWLERWALRGAAGVQVCNAEAGRRVQRKGFPGQPRLIPLGIDPAVFTPSTRRPAPSGPVKVGYVGRLVAYKGVDVLLEAVARDPDLHLTLAGAGPDEAAYRRRAEQADLAGRVTWLGGVDQAELPGVYASFDVLAIPSLTTKGWVEQFGRVAVEAMACGVPVVASDSGALPDVVGDAGVLVPEADPAALAAALLQVAREPGLNARLRDAGLARAQECSWSAVAAEFADLYRAAAHTPSLAAAEQDPEVVVVAYGSPELLAQTLAQVAGLTVTVVDNSSLESVRAVCQAAGVRYLDPGRNAGFGSGVNHALAQRAQPGADVLLLNPDARIDVQGVRALHRALRAEADLASVGPAQVDETGHSSRVAWPFPRPARSWVEAVGLGRLNRSADYVIGSVLMLRAEALAQLGGFDESFFLYAEETDWARRAARMGWRHTLVDSVTAVHVGAATSTDSARRTTHFHAGQERYLRKHHGALGWQVARAAQVVGGIVRGRVLPGDRGEAARARVELLRRGPVAVERELRPERVATA